MSSAQTWPAYLGLEVGEMRRRADEAVASLASCEVCPRNCRVDRLAGEAKVCSTGRLARVSSWFAHHGEEDCLRGTRGSGTIFFSCRNYRAAEYPEIDRLPTAAEMAEAHRRFRAAGLTRLDERAARRLWLIG